MHYIITTEYRHAQEGELFIENGAVRRSDGQWDSWCGRKNDQMGEVIVAITEVPEGTVAVKAVPLAELVNA